MAPRDRVVAFLQAFWREDLETAFMHLAPDALFCFAPSLPYTAERGREWPARDALERIVADMFTTFDADGPLAVTLTDTLAEGTDVMAAYTARGTVRGGRVYENDYVMRAGIGADVLIARLQPYNDTRHLWTLMME